MTAVAIQQNDKALYYTINGADLLVKPDFTTRAAIRPKIDANLYRDLIMKIYTTIHNHHMNTLKQEIILHHKHLRVNAYTVVNGPFRKGYQPIKTKEKLEEMIQVVDKSPDFLNKDGYDKYGNDIYGRDEDDYSVDRINYTCERKHSAKLFTMYKLT